MKEKIEILNCGLFNQKTGVKGSILKYRLLNPKYCVETKFLKGFSELVVFTSSDELFNLLQSNDFGVACELEYEQRVDIKDPLKTKMRASKLKIGTSIINLL